MTDGNKQGKSSSNWDKRFLWCQCGEPFDEEMEAVTSLLAEGYITTDEARESLNQTRELLDIIRHSYTEVELQDEGRQDHYRTIENDLIIAEEFTSALSNSSMSGRHSRLELLKRIISAHRDNQRKV